MDKGRDGDRGEKSRGGLPPGLDPATAALYANMFGGSGSLGAYQAQAQAVAAAGLGGWGGVPPGYHPPTSSAAGLASLAAAQQAQQAAALASLGPAAAAYQDRAALGAWWNLAGMQQMELLSRLQGGMPGSSNSAAAAAAAAAQLGGFGGLHPDHLMNLELLQAQHAAAAMAALINSSKAGSSSGSSSSKSSKVSSSISNNSHNSSNLNSSGKGITSTLNYRGSALTTTTSSSNRLHENNTRDSNRSNLEISRLASSSHSSSSNSSSKSHSYPYHTSHRYNSPIPGLESIAASHHSDKSSSPSLSYGIASLIADKHISHHKSQNHASSLSSTNSSSQAERVAEKLASNGSVSISKAIRNKELEIIPIPPAAKGSSQSHGSTTLHRDKSEPKVSISTVGSSSGSSSRLSNGLPSNVGWREESASVSIEPCGSTTSSSSTDDAPLNLSLKSTASPSQRLTPKSLDKKDHLKESRTNSPLSLSSRRETSPLDYPSSLHAGLGSGLAPSLEVLQSLYGQHGEPRDVLASMQEALQRQLLAADGKREEKKKRNEALNWSTYQMEEAQERSRHLGRGVSKPKKNTVASLLEQFRAAGIKPSSIPFPPTTSFPGIPLTTSPPLHVSSIRTGDSSLTITTASPTVNTSSSPSPASQSLPATLPLGIPGLPIHIPPALSASLGSSSLHPSTPPAPSLSISAVTATSTSESSNAITTLPTTTASSTLPSTTSTTFTSTPLSLTSVLSSTALPPPSSPSLLPPSSSRPSTPISVATSVSTSVPSVPSSSISSPTPPCSSPGLSPLTSSLPSSLPSLLAPNTSSSTPCSTSTSVSLPIPPVLSLSSSVSITSVLPESSMATLLNNKPSVTIHPATSNADDQERPKDSSTIENSVDILALGQAQENGDKPSKKRHMVTSSSVDGRLITTIKAASTVMDSSEVSDSDSDDDSTSMSSLDDESNHLLSPWLKRDATDSPSVYGDSPPTKKRKMITDEVSLRVPLMFGWRRETTIRTITQSGVRGEVVYHAPCGKPFKQYPDIVRYLEKNGISEITRDNFSFSSKIPVGEYIDPQNSNRYTEDDVRDKILEIREKKGYKPQRKNEENKDALEVEAETILRRLEAEEEADKARKDFMNQIEEQQKMRILREQERLQKQEEMRKEREELRKQKEEENRQRLYDQLRKAQEREQEKQKQKLLKEQERERRRYHGVLVRAIEARKRYEDRERRREEVKEEKRATRERKREERIQARELNLLLKEVKEDMELTDHISLPDMERIEGNRLPPEAFGNTLMLFEFLNNFGEILGFDMDSLPSLQSLQMALLNDNESEEELLSILSHLLVCAIDDPGIPNSQRYTTILGQTLSRADITHNNISEILRVYLYANATGEVRVLHGLAGTEKERRENPKKGEEWDARLAEMEAYKMSEWLLRIPFLALNPTQKSEIIAYVCNELLQNKSIIKQIEDSLDKHNGLKTEKWKLDARIRKLRMSVVRKRIYNAAMRNIETRAGGEDSNMSGVSAVSSCHGDQDKGDKKDKEGKEEEDDEDDDEDNESGNDSDVMEEVPDEVLPFCSKEDDKHLNADDASKTLDILQRQMDQVRQDLFETAQQVRGFYGGQDRYQRTMWVLPHAGGPFFEGLTTCDYYGRDHFPLDIPSSAPKDGLDYDEMQEKVEALRKEKERIREEQKAKEKVKEEVKIKEECVEIKAENELKVEKKEETSEDVDNKENIDIKPLNGQIKEEEEEEEEEEGEEEEEEDNSEVPDIPKKSDKVKEEVKEEDKKDLKHIDTQNGVSEAKTNGSTTAGDVYSTLINAGLNPYSIVNGLKDEIKSNNSNNISTEGIDQNLLATGLGLVPGQYLRPEHIAQREKLSFSLLPRISCDVSSLELLPTGQTPQCTPRGSPREPSPFSRHSGPQSPIIAASQTPFSTPTAPNDSGDFVTLSAPGTPAPSTPGNNLTVLGNVNNSSSSVHNNQLSSSTSSSGGINVANSTDTSNKELLEKLHQTVKALPIPNEYKRGWWHFSEVESLREMTIALNDRGVRERELKRFLEKNFTIVKNALSGVDADTVVLDPDIEEEENILYDEYGTPVADEAPHWSPDIAYKFDLQILENVYSMEERVTNASMQNKQSWKLSDMPRPTGQFLASCHDPDEKDTRHNPIHVGRERLLALEEGIERRYLKPPLGMAPSPKNEPPPPPDSELPKGLQMWREAVEKCETAAQLAMCTYMLETAVAWDKSIMKAYCQFCHSGDHEEKLLLCDGCDKGYHTHCFKPPMVNIPDGDWYCYECVNKFNDGSPRHCLVCGGTEGRTLVPCSSCPRAYHTNCIIPNLAKVPRNKWVCPACTAKNPKSKRGRTKKTSESAVVKEKETAKEVPISTPDPPAENSKEDSPSNTTTPTATPKKERNTKKKDQKDLLACKTIVTDLEGREDAWPFLLPVNTRQFPTYKKIIKKPMDLSVIKKKLEDNVYKTKEDYCEDIRLMFNNCETFNEDDSPVGKAGHNLRSFFEERWNELFPPT